MISNLSMQRQGRAQKAQKPRATSASIAAPTGGWNARDALGAMDPMDAVTMENWWPGTTAVILRFGYTNFATGLGSQVESLMEYSGGATAKLKAATAGGSVYDVTSGGAVGAAELSGMSNGRWQHANFTTPAGSYICMVNGADRYRVYNGTAWFKDTDGAPYDITGVTSTTLIGINVFKNRLWFVQTASLKAWYLPVNSIGGAAAALDMSSLCEDGGFLMAMGTWTLDAGYGVDDYAVFITSNGEVLVWRMTDPTDPNSIFLIGVWRIGSPVGRRCMFKYVGDLLVITHDGLVPLAGALQSSRFNPRVALTDKIQYAMSQAITAYGGNFGWQLEYFAKQNQLYMNVPVGTGNQQQYVMNSITKSWCNFTGWVANCFEIFNEDLYYGGNGAVCKAWNTNADAGQAINSIGLQAFSYYKGRAQLKRVTMMRPTIYTNGSPSLSANINYDFDLSNTTSPISITPTQYGTWDSGVWDTALWGGSVNISLDWQSTTGLGYAVAPRLNASSNGIEVQWVSTDLVMEAGGIL